MIRWLVPAARLAMDGNPIEPVRGLRRQHQVIDANTIVLAPCAGLKIPKRIGRRIGYGAHGIGQSKVGKFAELLEALGPKKGIAPPGSRVVAIVTGRDEIEIAQKNERLLQRQPRFDKRLQALHPGKFVWKLLAIDRVAIGQIDVAHAHDA